ncbi:MAG: histidine kinase [Sphingobacteriaceae bacterium]|nr:histidine kinase [Sphingobacteriaceae bacterium]
MISNICKSLTIDSEFVWVCTNRGISRIRYNGPKDYDIHNYSLSSFVEPTSINKVHVLKNSITFTSGNKLYWFNRNNDASDSRMRIVSIVVNGKNIPHNLPCTEYYQSDIKIEFEALLYDCSVDLNYRYKLGTSDPWIYTKETSITFQKLASGNYNLEIEVLNKQGNWVSLSKPLIINIDKPIYQKTWFIIILVLGLSGLTFFILRRRYMLILKEERIKSQLKINMLELETKVVKAQMNPHFIFNSLNSIQQFILASENENAYRYLTKFSKLVRRLLESTTTEDLTLEDEIDLLNRYIEIEGLRFEDSFNYELHVDPQLKVSAIRIPHMIIQPFVENAIWHGFIAQKSVRVLRSLFIFG